MPIIDADKARTCLAIKRSMNPGFADNTLMLFGDAKAVIGEVVADLKGGTSIHWTVGRNKGRTSTSQPVCREINSRRERTGPVAQ
jgi:hypothetical protein